jgi:hypothetical protein
VATTARSPCPTRMKMLDSLLMCLLRLTVKVILREPRRRLNYLRGKESSGDYLRSLLNGLPLRYASIANCKTRREAPVAATARNPCATRVIQFVLFMCAYPMTDRTDNRMRRPPIHNKRTI